MKERDEGMTIKASLPRPTEEKGIKPNIGRASEAQITPSPGKNHTCKLGI